MPMTTRAFRGEKKNEYGEKFGFGGPDDVASVSYAEGLDLLAGQDVDPVLTAKMRIVNDAIDEIGWTPYHWKLFVLNGFGYAVDSQLLLLQSIIATQADYEFSSPYPRALTIAANVGMLVGALFWGLGADMVGRRFAFNVSLFICSIFTIAAGAAPNWIALASMVAMVGFGGGGNLTMDMTIFVEYLPSNKQWVLAWLASWWGLGQAFAGFIAWGFLPRQKWNCRNPFDDNGMRASTCHKYDNVGWRYIMYTSGAMVFIMSIARVTVIRLKETPKYLLSEGKDAQLVADFQIMAIKYNRPCSITFDMLDACGAINSIRGQSKSSISGLWVHFRGLFATHTLALSTSLIWLSWTLTGLAYPLFYLSLNSYLASRGADFGVASDFEKWRNYALVNISSIPGPMLAGYLCNRRLLGRKYTMVIGALTTTAFFFAFTQVRSQAQNVGFSCAMGFTYSVFYGTLYAYTAEVLPSAHRGTGHGVAVACNRAMGILSAVITAYADVTTSVPIYVCAALYIAMAAVAITFPLEPYGKRSS
ncbi:hypothetical protein LZ554_009527 [Drepanopeziza brunnea f. sp. 'monogermtubi']|nr:hypothetical protein LZ554_009527 [Drepanopeziza brunnea f. sp. 'monogermtubi']